MQGGMSMRESTIESLLAKYCYGDPEGKDSEILTYVDQFLHGLNKLSGLYETASRELDQQDVLTMLPALHCQNGLNIYVGEGSIEKELLSQKSLTITTQQISGRTLLCLAKEVLCNCKKMMALLVTDMTSPYKNGTYPSGMTWEDYARWCLSAFYHSECGVAKSNDVCFGESSKQDERRPDEITVDAGTEKMMSSPICHAHDENSDAIAIQQEIDQQSQFPIPPTDTDPLSPWPSGAPAGYFFKGYLAWCLWGHIPVAPQSGSTSMLFTDVKVDASFGRNAGSRAALLKRRADCATTKNARKKRMQEDGGAPISTSEATSLCDSKITTTTLSKERSGIVESNIGGIMGILTKTLAFISEESLERELQKNAILIIRRVRKSRLQIKSMISFQRPSTTMIKAQTPTFGTNSYSDFRRMRPKSASWKRSLMSCLMQRPIDDKRFCLIVRQCIILSSKMNENKKREE